MIITKDVDNYDNEIQLILSKSADLLEKRSLTDKSLLKLSGVAFEKEVCQALNQVSHGTAFYNRFEQASTHAFPDIYAKIVEKRWFGVEVKTSQNDWKCFGNSIFESTRIGNLEDRIFVFFGKFANPLECRWARFDHCIDNINITHSPRYQINMDTNKDLSQSVFTKMKITYKEFHQASVASRMEFVRRLKRQSVGEDVALWWLPDHEQPTKEDEEKLIIKSFSSLSKKQRSEIKLAALALLPELFSNGGKKYNRLLKWLASQHGVVTGNARDMYTAGGQIQIQFKSIKYSLPRICCYLIDNPEFIKSTIFQTPHEELEVRWSVFNCPIPQDNVGRIRLWIDKVSEYLKEQASMPKNFPVKDWIAKEFNI